MEQVSSRRQATSPARSDRRGGACATGSRRHEPPVIRKLVGFVDQRSGGAPFIRKTLRYLFPDHWSFLLGEVALYAFIVLVGTGVYLTLFFKPSLTQVHYHG